MHFLRRKLPKVFDQIFVNIVLPGIPVLQLYMIINYLYKWTIYLIWSHVNSYGTFGG